MDPMLELNTDSEVATDSEGEESDTETGSAANDTPWHYQGSSLDPVELRLGQLCLNGNFSSTQGQLVQKMLNDLGHPTRGYSTITNTMAKESLPSFSYAKCPTCKVAVRKAGKKYHCNTCREDFAKDSKVDYVSFDLEPWIQKVTSEVAKSAAELETDKDGVTMLNLVITCDGVPISKSSQCQLYPVVLYIENLKDAHLMSRCYLISSFALVKSGGKIDFDMLLSPLVEAFLKLTMNPIKTDWAEKTSISIFAFLADAPCRADILQMKRFNATHPCHRCHVSRKNGRIPIYQPQMLFPKTMELVESYAVRRRARGKDNFQGVKKVSILKKLRFDYIKNTPVEIMHSVFLGLVRRFLLITMIEGLKPEQTAEVERRIKMIKPPSNIKRMPRSLKEFKRFKSAELENWFFYFGQFLLKGVISEEMYTFFMFLSSAVFKLYSRNTNLDEVAEAGDEILHFMKVYGEGEMSDGYMQPVPDWFTYNLHCMLHLYEDRDRLGPLSKMNAYFYESQLQNFKKIFKSKNRRLATLVKNVKLQALIPIREREDVITLSKPCKVTDERLLSEIKFRSRLNDAEMRQVRFYKFFEYGFMNVTCSNYEKRTNNVDSFVRYKDEFYQVSAIYVSKKVKCCLLEKLQISTHPEIRLTSRVTKITHTHIVTQKSTGIFTTCHIDSIQKQVCYLGFDESLAGTFNQNLEYVVEIEN